MLVSIWIGQRKCPNIYSDKKFLEQYHMKTHFKESFLENSTETLRAIAHPIRIAIMDLLYKNGQMTVTDIYTKLNIEQAIASHHLRILKNKKVVVVQRDGKNSLYSLASRDFYDIVETLTKVL